VLSIDPASRGFGFCVLEVAGRLVDWGTRSARSRHNRNERCVAIVKKLIEEYQPDVLVTEKCDGHGWRRHIRVRELIDALVNLAHEQKIKARQFTQKEVRAAFGVDEATTKHDIARAIANRFPELEPALPDRRKAGDNEAHHERTFSAIGLAVTFWHERK